MSLARGEGTFEAAIVIAVAPTHEERLRVARLVGPDVAVMLVASREEAIAALLGNEPPRVSTIGLTVDSDLRTASYEGVSVPLSPLEHDLLRYLVREVGRTWQFEVLHREIWGTGHLGGLADVHAVVKRLRRKLRDLRCPVRISSVRGVGLRLDGMLATA
jgi:DNA-binding response OmpR family regulator